MNAEGGLSLLDILKSHKTHTATTCNCDEKIGALLDAAQFSDDSFFSPVSRFRDPNKLQSPK